MEAFIYQAIALGVSVIALANAYRLYRKGIKK